MPHQLTKAISLIAFIMLVFSPFIIPISVQEGEQIKLWHKWLSENPPDENAKELIVTRSIPSNDQTDINFWGIRHICIRNITPIQFVILLSLWTVMDTKRSFYFRLILKIE